MRRPSREHRDRPGRARSSTVPAMLPCRPGPTATIPRDIEGLNFLAPEILRGGESDAPADVYGLGAVMMYRSREGAIAHSGRRIHQRESSVSVRLPVLSRRGEDPLQAGVRSSFREALRKVQIRRVAGTQTSSRPTLPLPLADGSIAASMRRHFFGRHRRISLILAGLPAGIIRGRFGCRLAHFDSTAVLP